MAQTSRVFIKSLNQAENLVNFENKAEKTTFLKQIGSNHILFDKRISFSPKNEYKLAAERSEAAFQSLEKSFLAEATGFEPARALRLKGLANPRNGPSYATPPD